MQPITLNSSQSVKRELILITSNILLMVHHMDLLVRDLIKASLQSITIGLIIPIIRGNFKQEMDKVTLRENKDTRS
jgi:hypothetical protein